MAKSVSTENFVVQNVILSYPALFQPRQVNNQGDPKYSVKLFFDANGANEIYAKAQEIAAQAFTNGETQNPNFRWAIAPVSGSDAQNPRLTGLYAGNAKADVDYPPQVVGPDRQPILDRGQIYAGCIVAVGISLYTYNNMGNIGVGMGLKAVMKTADGEHLAEGGVDAQTMFAGVQASAAPVGQPMPGGMSIQQPASPQGVMPQGAPATTAQPQQVPVQPMAQPTGTPVQPTGMPTPPFMQNQ